RTPRVGRVPRRAAARDQWRSRAAASTRHAHAHTWMRSRGSPRGPRVNTRTIDARTLWAVLAMEVALALPVISLPGQGDRIPGLLGPLLLVLLLPAGYFAVYHYSALRDPSWRLLTAIGLALSGRLIVSIIP